ncbi:hypothetical protein ACFSN5_04245 [Streptococcus tangpeifui]|uniref:hypothetical protein n=1 Tax=Streptococcus tangpeifui TaxID=2709400 RepID=UPI0013EC1FCF|nr:hypothetical protein [Streptococcus sp. ZJ373]
MKNSERIIWCSAFTFFSVALVARLLINQLSHPLGLLLLISTVVATGKQAFIKK